MWAMRLAGRATGRLALVALRTNLLTREIHQLLPLKNINADCLSRRSYATKLRSSTQSEDFFMRQLFDRESCTYSYLLADAVSKDAIVIDPVIDFLERDMEIVFELGLRIKYALNTHMHSDHVTASGQLKKRIPYCQTVIAASSGAIADILVRHGDLIQFGKHTIEVRATPGHTNGCVTYICHEQGVAFTGDTLLIRGCGRTDFQQGNPDTLYESIFNQIFSLPNSFSLYPGHDYRGRTVTTVGEEKRYNPRLTRSKEEFIHIMKTLNLDFPNKLENSLPANQVCGLYNLPSEMNGQRY